MFTVFCRPQCFCLLCRKDSPFLSVFLCCSVTRLGQPDIFSIQVQCVGGLAFDISSPPLHPAAKVTAWSPRKLIKGRSQSATAVQTIQRPSIGNSQAGKLLLSFHSVLWTQHAWPFLFSVPTSWFPAAFILCSLAIHRQSFSYVSFAALQTSIVKLHSLTVLAAVALKV